MPATSRKQKPALPAKPVLSEQKSRSPEPLIEPMVRNYSKFAAEASAPPSPAEFKVPRPNLKPTSPSSSKNKNGTMNEGDRAAFEAELANGRSKLKKVWERQTDEYVRCNSRNFLRRNMHSRVRR